MSKPNRYFLIARDRETNHFQIVPTSSQYGSTLEEIDLYTTDFMDEKELAGYLRGQGLEIPQSTDFYIVTQVKRGGQVFLRKLEVLFSDSREVQDIADASLQKKIHKSQDAIDHVYHRFFQKFQKRSDFYDFVVYGKTSLYDKFVKLLPNWRLQSPYATRYEGNSWIIKSYYLIRNILETMSRFENQHYAFMNDDLYRRQLDTDLLRVTHKDYDPNQISLFDEMDRGEEVEENGFQKRYNGTRVN